jgi:hypothetical protein
MSLAGGGRPERLLCERKLFLEWEWEWVTIADDFLSSVVWT